MIFVTIVTIIFDPYISRILQNNDKISFLGSSLQNRASCYKIHIEQNHGQSIKFDYINHLHNVKATTSRQLKIGPVRDLSVLKKISPTTFFIRCFLVSYLVTKLRHSRNLLVWLPWYEARAFAITHVETFSGTRTRPPQPSRYANRRLETFRGANRHLLRKLSAFTALRLPPFAKASFFPVSDSSEIFLLDDRGLVRV